MNAGGPPERRAADPAAPAGGSVIEIGTPQVEEAAAGPREGVEPSPHTQRLGLLLGLQQRLMAAGGCAELAFVLANESFHLVPYAQASVWLPDSWNGPRLQCISGLAEAPADTPFALWLRALVTELLAAAPGGARPEARRLVAADVGQPHQAGWAEFLPAHVMAVPLTSGVGHEQGLLLLARDDPFSDADAGLAGALGQTAATALAALQAGPDRARRWRALARRRSRAWWMGAAVAAACVPVHVSVVAPAEIVALHSVAVAAPADGVVKALHVQPNQPVKRGQLLFSLDDTTLRNRRQVAEQALGVARADVLAAQQKAFDNTQSRSELAALHGRVHEREAELAYLAESLQRIEVRAEQDGVFVYADANDWLGKPVVTGERIAQLAQPDALGVLVWLPVGDAINLEPGAAMRVYLQSAPLVSLAGELVQTSYQATLSPESVASYRIRGQLAAGERAHIGLRGVAKVYGDWQPAAYWLLRRPLGAVRQWAGL